MLHSHCYVTTGLDDNFIVATKKSTNFAVDSYHLPQQCKHRILCFYQSATTFGCKTFEVYVILLLTFFAVKVWCKSIKKLPAYSPAAFPACISRQPAERVVAGQPPVVDIAVGSPPELSSVCLLHHPFQSSSFHNDSVHLSLAALPLSVFGPKHHVTYVH